MSVVAHFFMSVGGSEIHERLAHFFIDFYTLTEVVNIRHHRTIVSAAFAQSFAPSVQL